VTRSIRISSPGDLTLESAEVRSDRASAAILRDRVLAPLVTVREKIADGDLALAEAAAESAELELAAIIDSLEAAA
jgi:hypothetical protein